jgi:hypothetical protein
MNHLFKLVNYRYLIILAKINVLLSAMVLDLSLIPKLRLSISYPRFYPLHG